MLLLNRRPQAALQCTTSSRCCFRTASYTTAAATSSSRMSVTSQGKPLKPGSHTDKAVGCILAALCGDALGAAVEGWTAYRVQKDFPNGLTHFQECRMGRGCYTDDGQMLLALAASLVNHQGACRASAVATEYAKAFDPARGYGGSAQQILAKLQAQLQQGPLPATMGTELMAQGGSYGNGGAMRIAPLGLAYRNAPVDALHHALIQTLIPTHHLHPWAIEGALAQALAVAHLCKLQPSQHDGPQAPTTAAESPPSAAAAAARETAAAAGKAAAGTAAAAPATGAESPAGLAGLAGPAAAAAADPPAGAAELLRGLQSQLQGRSDVMCSRLAAMEQGLKQLYATPGGPKRASHTWQDYFARPAWQEELSTAAAVAPGEPGFQIKGTDAVAAAIWACVAHWEGAPDDAVVAAVHYGGDTDTIACMAGALVGARHGSSWLPQHWLGQLEQDAAGSTFFDEAAVQSLLSQQEAVSSTAGGAADGKQQQQAECGGGEAVVYHTRNMGREGAVVLAMFLAQLDCA